MGGRAKGAEWQVLRFEELVAVHCKWFEARKEN
jgi:hypothetical protein